MIEDSVKKEVWHTGFSGHNNSHICQAKRANPAYITLKAFGLCTPSHRRRNGISFHSLARPTLALLFLGLFE
jgi:hypothetical protein